MAGRRQARAARAQGNYAPGSAGAAAAAKAKATAATTANAAREDLIDRAVAGGVINDGMRAHYQRAYDADPEGCRAFLGKLPGGASLAASSAAADDEYDSGWLTAGERARVESARAEAESRNRRRIVNGD